MAWRWMGLKTTGKWCWHEIMDHEDVRLDKQDGTDGIWFKDCGIDAIQFYELFKTRMHVAVGLNNQFNGVGFHSIFENKDVPFYYFTNLRNHRLKRLEYEMLPDGGGIVSQDMLDDWYDNEPCFYSDVFVKFWRKDVTSEAQRKAWAEFWKSLVLSFGMSVFNGCAVSQRYWFLHKSDINHLEGTLLHSSFGRNKIEYTVEIRDSLDHYITATYNVGEINRKRTCSFCGWYDGSRIKQCPCKSGVRYCSPKCQSVHWRMVHKKECAWKKE